MNAKELKIGMVVVADNGIKVRVTHVPQLDQYGECFFSGVVVGAEDDFYKDQLGVNFHENWNSAFFNQ